ncbi:MAG: S-adenosylmethionine decarboxylase [Nanoarchaeota archaeon]
MRDLAPKIYRQRLVIEGIYTIEITPQRLKDYLKDLSTKLGSTIIFGPIIKNLAGKINSIHEGFEGVLIWAESGVSIYTWKKENFFTIDIYTCKKFNNRTAVKFTKEFFKTKDIVFKSV